MAQEGWICPKCGKVNAPWVPECNCSGNNKVTCITLNGDEKNVTCTTQSKFETVTSTADQMICS